MKSLKEERDGANSEQNGVASTETDNLEEMLFGLETVLRQKSFSRMLWTFKTNVVYCSFAEYLKVLVDVRVGQSSRNEVPEQVKDEHYCTYEKVNE